MKHENGMTYSQNYDVVTKWLAAALRGKTLDVLGIHTGRIEEVFGFEPTEIPVVIGRVDVLARDETGALYHLEEQRDLRKADLYRFAAYHFLAAKQWGVQITDIILASGDVCQGEKRITTNSGTYTPMIIDFTQRDGHQRLAEIRNAIQAGTFTNWLELVFLPLYGKETGMARSELVEHVLRFESELYHAKQLPGNVLIATLIVSNKLIEKDRLQAIWEGIKMLDIFEIAKEEGIKIGIQEGKTIGIQEGKTIGIQEGKTIGIQEGKSLGSVETTREMVVDALLERFPLVPPTISEKIRTIHNLDLLRGLHRQAVRCKDLQEFTAIVQQAV